MRSQLFRGDAEFHQVAADTQVTVTFGWQGSAQSWPGGAT